jgi:SAM-dependent methyltransferase
MEINDTIKFLNHPGADSPSNFEIKDRYLLDQERDKQYKIHRGMVDFLGTFTEDASKKDSRLLFQLNNYYSHHVDSRILSTIFAGGGIGFIKADKKLKQWIDQFMQNGPVLFIEPENRHELSFIDPQRCLTVKDYSQKNVEPLPEDFPDLNASPEQLPIHPDSFDHVISNFVLEHIKNPRQHIREIARVLKPGGYCVISGPGDVYPSHKVPFNYFNIIRYGYFEMFTENDLDVIEEYFPSKSWMSILYLMYITTVRNSWFNTNQVTKLIQMVVFIISIFIAPLLNLLAFLLDLITPFDKRVYGIYMALVRKR